MLDNLEEIELVGLLNKTKDIFPAAFLYENEIHDLFGIAIEGINHDYNGKLYRTAVEAPFA